MVQQREPQFCLRPCDQRTTTKHGRMMAPVTSSRRKVSTTTTTSGIIKTKTRHLHRRLRSDWSNIHNGVLEKTHKLQLPDILRCRAVCTSWRTETLAHVSSSSSDAVSLSPPPLIIWSRYGCYWFLDVARPENNNLYHLNHRSKRLLCEKMGRFVGFSHGWFLFIDKNKNNTLCLFHPLLFSTAAARLPPIVTPKGFSSPILDPEADDDDGVKKAVLWADPILSGNHGVALIHPCYKHIIFAKAGAAKFTGLEEYEDDDDDDDDLPRRRRVWHDIICFQNLIYGVTLTEDGRHHHMEAWDCAGEDGPRKVLDVQPKFSSGSRPYSSFSTLYLVESQGDLLLVSIERPSVGKLRGRKRIASVSELFVAARSPNLVRVHKMDFERMEWVQMNSIGDRVLFVMEEQNISVSADDFTQYERNTVYFMHFIDMNGPVTSCLGVFNMEDGSVKEIWPQRE